MKNNNLPKLHYIGKKNNKEGVAPAPSLSLPLLNLPSLNLPKLNYVGKRNTQGSDTAPALNLPPLNYKGKKNAQDADALELPPLNYKKKEPESVMEEPTESEIMTFKEKLQAAVEMWEAKIKALSTGTVQETVGGAAKKPPTTVEEKLAAVLTGGKKPDATSPTPVDVEKAPAGATQNVNTEDYDSEEYGAALKKQIDELTEATRWRASTTGVNISDGIKKKEDLKTLKAEYAAWKDNRRKNAFSPLSKEDLGFLDQHINGQGEDGQQLVKSSEEYGAALKKQIDELTEETRWRAPTTGVNISDGIKKKEDLKALEAEYDRWKQDVYSANQHQALSALSPEDFALLGQYEYARHLVTAGGGDWKSYSGEEQTAIRSGEAAGKTLKQKYDKKALSSLLEYYTKAQNTKRQVYLDENNTAFAQEHPVLASAASLGTNLLSAPLAAMELIKVPFNPNDYAALDVNSPAFAGVNATQALRGGVSESIDSELGKLLYSTGMSAADSLIAAGFGQNWGGALLGATAAANTMKDITQRGGSSAQAIMGGLMSGTFETLFERVSIGNFEALKETIDVRSIKSILKNLGKSALVNASEEGLTEVANIIYDTVAMGDISNYSLRLRELMAEGLSEGDAKSALARELGAAVGMSGISGMLMGVLFAGVGGTSSYLSGRSATGAQGGDQNTVIPGAAVDGAETNEAGEDPLEGLRPYIELPPGVSAEQEAADTSRAPIQKGREQLTGEVPTAYDTTVSQEGDAVNPSVRSGNENETLENQSAQDARFSIVSLDDGRRMTVVDTGQDAFANVPKSGYARIARSIIIDKFKGQALPLSDMDLARVTNKSGGEYAYPNRRYEEDSSEYAAKMKASPELDNLLATAEYSHHAQDTKNHPEASLGWDYYKTTFAVDGKVFEGLINIATSEKGRVLYDITNVKEMPNGNAYEMAIGEQKEEGSTAISSKHVPSLGRSSATSPEPSSINTTVPQDWDTVNPSIRRSNENETLAAGDEGNNNLTEGATYGEEGTETGVLHDGGSQRDASTGSGGESGVLASSTGKNPKRNTQARSSVERLLKAENAGVREQSTQDLGAVNGAGTDAIRVLPETLYDEELVNISTRAKENGYDLAVVLGAMHFDTRFGQTVAAEGYYADGQIFARGDSKKWSPTQLANHEMFHGIAADNPGLVYALSEEVLSHYSDAEFEKLLEKYEQAYDGALTDRMNIIEEILADVYAGMDRLNLGITEDTESVRTITEGRTQARHIDGGAVVTTRGSPIGKANTGQGRAGASGGERNTSGERDTDGRFSLLNETNEELQARIAELDEAQTMLVASRDTMDTAEYNVKWYAIATEKQTYKSELGERRTEERKKAAKQRREAAREKAKNPTISMRELGTALINLYSIPEGSRAALRQEINGIAGNMLAKGYTAESDLQALLEKLYESGSVTVDPDAAYQDIAQTLKGQTLYVSPETRGEFGDGWQDFRKHLFGLGIYTSSNLANTAVDSQYQELAGKYPGLFNEENADQRIMLEEMAEAVRFGRPEHISLAENANRNQVDPEADFDYLYRHASNALSTFAEKAGLETRLKTDVIEAQEKAETQQGRQNERLERQKNHYLEIARRGQERREQSAKMQQTLKAITRLRRLAKYNSQTFEAAFNEQTPQVQQMMQSALRDIETSATRLTGEKQLRLEDLRNKYTDVLENNPNYIPTKTTQDAIARLDKIHLNDMKVSDIEDLYRAVVSLEHTIQTADREIGANTKRKFKDMYEAVREEFSEHPHKGRGAVDNFFNKEQLSPARALLRFVGYDRNSTWGSVVESLEQGDIDAAGYSMGAGRLFDDFMKNPKNQKWLQTAAGKNADTISIELPKINQWGEGDAPIFDEKSGNPVTVKLEATPMMLAQMALDVRNNDNMRHIKYGGYTFPDMDLYRKGDTRAALAQGTTVKVAPETVKKIVKDNMTPELKAYVDLLSDYYNKYSRDHMNRISREMDGFDRAITTNYSPIRTDHNYLAQESGKTDATIMGMGPLQERVQSGSPVLLDDADAVMRWHRDSMSKYVGYAIPLRNLQMLLNYTELGYSGSTKEVIAKTQGINAADYIERLIGRIQSGDRAGPKSSLERLAGKLTSGYVRNVLFFNLSSSFKQLAALPLAGTSIGQGAILHSMIPGAARGTDLATIRAYTPLVDYRSAGYTFRELAEYVRNQEGAQQSNLAQALTGRNWMTAIDTWASRRMWDASCYYVTKQTGLRPGTDAEIESGTDPYYRRVAEVFNRLVLDTQTNNNTMSRPEILTKTDALTRMFTMFKTDALQMQGVFREKMGAMQTAKQKYKKSKTPENRAQLKAANKAYIRGVSGIVASSLTSALMEMAAKLLIKTDDDYRDEEGELSLDAAGKEIMRDALYNTVGSMILGDQIADFIAHVFTGETLWEPDVPSISSAYKLVGSLVDTGEELGRVIGTSIEILKADGELTFGAYIKSEGDVLLGTVKKLGNQVARLAGIPVQNMEKTLLGFVGHAFPSTAVVWNDLFTQAAKKDLAGLKGKELTAGITAYLSDVAGNVSGKDAKEIQRLYEAYGAQVLPGADTPKTFKYGEGDDVTEKEVSLYNGSLWDMVYRDTLEAGIPQLFSSTAYKKLSDDEKQDSLRRLNDYAKERAYQELGGNAKTSAEQIASAVDAGVELPDATAFYVRIRSMESDTDENGDTIDGSLARKKIDALLDMNIGGMEKQALYRLMVSSANDDKIQEIMASGVTFDKYLKAHSMYSQINGNPLKAGEKRVEFAHWLDTQDYTSNQMEVIKDNFRYYSMGSASESQYEKLTSGGLSEKSAYALAGVLSDLEVLPGETKVTNLQKYEAVIGTDMSEKEQMSALSVLMSESENKRLEVGTSNGITLARYVQVKSAIAQINDNNSVTQEEAKRAIDSIPGLSDAERAILWQLQGNWKSKNNPYSTYTGNRIYQELYGEDDLRIELPSLG